MKLAEQNVFKSLDLYSILNMRSNHRVQVKNVAENENL